MRWFISFCATFFWFATSAQDWGLEASTGALVVHRQTMESLYDGYQNGYHVVYHANLDPRQVQGRENFAFRADFFHTDLSNDAELGKAVGAAFGIRKMLGFGKLKPHYFLTAGLGYLSKTFHKDNNYKNIAIGSKLNAAIRVGGGLLWNPIERLGVNAGLQVLHFSNGSVKIPNKGLNFIGYHLGVHYRLREGRNYGYSTDIEPGPLGFRIMYFAGAKETIPFGGKTYMTHSFGMDRIWEKEKIVWSTGLDLFYNRSLIAEGKARDVEVDNSELQRLGFHVGGEPVFGKFRMVLQLGLYFKDDLNFNGIMYHRLGWVYQTNVLDFHLGLKSHFAKADHLEIGISKRW